MEWDDRCATARGKSPEQLQLVVTDEQGALRRVKLDLQRSTATQLQQIAAKACTFRERRRLSAIEVGVQCLSVTTMAAAVARLPTEAKRSDRLLGGMCVSWPRFASDTLRVARGKTEASGMRSFNRVSSLRGWSWG